MCLAACDSSYNCEHRMEAVTRVLLFNFAIALVIASSGGRSYYQQFTIPEEQPTGTVIGRIGSTTSDAYLPPPPYQLYFRSRAAETHFSVSRENGTIAILSPIDRESRMTSSSAASGSNFRFEFVATSVGGETIAVTIQVVDVNDHAPTFPDSLVRLVIPESADVAAARFALPRATDPDIGTNSVQRYRIISGNEDDKFRLISSPTTSGADVPAGTRLELGLQSELDHESRSDYLLVVEAVDGGRPTAGVGTMTVIVSVSDSNDNWPTFDKEQYEATIAEDSDVGTEVVRVRATDRDSGANGRVRYRIDRVSPTTAPATADPVRGRGNIGSATHPFEIGATSGQLVLRRKLDYEMSTGYELVVVAEDAGERSLQRSVRVSIQVQNVNDNPPTIDVMFLSDSSDGISDPFQSSTSTARVPRLSMSQFRKGQPVARVYVFDRDLSAANSDSARPPTVSLRVVTPRLIDSTTAGSANESFSLTVVPSAQTATTSTEYLVVVAADWLSDVWYRLIITAVDSGSLTASRVVDIFVDDDRIEDDDGDVVQRRTPDMLRFNQSAYYSSVSTKVLPGTAITTVQASFVATTDVKNLSESNFSSTSPSKFRSVVYSLFIANEAGGVIAVNETGSDTSAMTARALNSRRSMTSDKFRIGRKSGIVRTSGRLVCDQIMEKPVFNGSANVRIVIIATEVIEPTHRSAVTSSTRRKSRSAAITMDVKIVNYNSAIDDDDDDDRVTFEHSFYESSVLENATLGHCFLTVSMIGDRCATNRLRFAIRSSRNTSLSTSKGSSQMPPAEIYVDEHTGQLCVNASLDYESIPFYELPIVALSTSGKTMASTNVMVRVIDINDNKPVFSQSAYNVTLRVHRGGNTTSPTEWSKVTVVKATDGDSGPCGQVFYHIDAGNEANVFMVDKTSGIIYFSWDAYSAYVLPETDVTYQLTIAASDGCRRRDSGSHSEDGILSMSSKTVVSIRLVAPFETGLSLTSSELPSFDPILYRFNISGSANRHHVIGCVAIPDVFQGWKRPLYSIKDQLSTAIGWLQINDSTGCIRTTKALPHPDAKSFTRFTVFAKFERERTVTYRTNTSVEVYAEVVVEVEQADDSHNLGSVSVEPALVHLSVREDSPVSTLIYRPSLHAIRRRQFPNGLAGSYIRYVLSPSTPSAAVVHNATESLPPHFSVDELTGNIRIIRRLDRETAAVHRVTMKAFEVSSDDVTKSGVLVQHLDIEVRVIDVNDNNPLFDQSLYRCRLPPPSSNNDDVTFVDSSADNSPLCSVRATDADQGHAAQLAYYFDDGDGGVLNEAEVFEIDPLSGEIWWSTAVVRNEMLVKCPPETYRLTVVAVDNGNPTRSSTSTVVIAATAAGSCQPRFDVARPVLSVTENSPIGSRVGAVQAMVGVGTERRQAYGVRYMLVANQHSPAAEGDTDGGADGKFRVDSETGEIFTNVLLDREEGNRYVVTLLASATRTDESHPYFNVTSDVIIDVSDVNDNCPIFVNVDDYGITKCGLELTVSENQPSGTTVAILSAVDKDTGPNADIVYSLISDSDTLRCAGAFEIDHSSGRLMTTTRNILKRYQTPSCTLKVSAADGGKPQCRTVQIITVYVVDDDVKDLLSDDEDVEDNGDVTPPLPVVPVSNFTFTVSRDATPGTTIGYVRLPSDTIVSLLQGWNASRSEHRANAGGNGGRSALAEFQYILVRGNHLNQFEIDRLTGAIILVRPLTSCSVYNLQIAAVLKHHESSSRNRSNDELSGNGSVKQPLGATIYATVRLTGSVQMSRNRMFDQLDPVLITIRPELHIGSRIFSASSVLTFPGPDGPWSYALTSQRCENQEGTETDCHALKIDSSTGHVVLFAQPTECRVIFASIVAVEEREMLNDVATPEDGDVREPAASFTLVVELDVVNYDAPEFDFRLWSVSVDENALIGQEIIRLNATYVDDDMEVNLKYAETSGIMYRIQSGNDDLHFELEQNTGILRISNHLDYEVTSSYQLEVVAQNAAKSNRQSTATVIIEVQNVNDCRPDFGQRLYDAFLSEDTTPGTFVLQLTAYDADNGSPTNTTGIRYKMASGSNSEGIFELNSTNGILTTVSQLDREKKDKYVITVLATDGLNFDSCDVTIHVTDVNDNWPVFHSRRSYDITDQEIAQSDDIIAKVYARDADIGNNGVVTYWIAGGNIDNVFSIDPLSGGLFVNPDTRGAFLRRQHSNQSVTYNLTITATDSGLPVPRTSSSFVVLRVLSDVELTPTLQFQVPEGQYNVTLAEDTAIGSAVLTIRAELIQSPRGTAVQNRISTERYRRADGVRQLNPDKDDRKFQRRQRSRREEDVADPEIKYSLALDSDVEGRFAVDSRTGVVYLVRSLDYERRQHYRFSVTATLGRGGGLSTSSVRPIQTSVDVEVNVTDVSDSRYVFDRAVYRADVSVDLSVGERVLTVRAADAVSGLFPVTYSIMDKLTFLGINSSTGDVFVRGPIESNVKPTSTIMTSSVPTAITSSVNNHVFRLSADALTVGSILFARIVERENVAIKRPRLQFTDEEYHVTTDENVAAGTVLLTLGMQTISGPNTTSDIFSRILIASGNHDHCFNVDSRTGDLTVAKSDCIDYEVASMRRLGLLLLSSSDGLVDCTEVVINVRDLNDNQPLFPVSISAASDKGGYATEVSVRVDEGAPRGTVISVLRAWDADQCSQLRYELVTGNLRNEIALEATPETGSGNGRGGAVLRTTVELDREIRSSYRLVVRVVDDDRLCAGTMSPERHSATAIITVTVSDVNDNAPFFPASNQPVNVREDAETGTTVVQITANDIDLDTVLTYRITGGNTGDVFEIDRRTGRIFLVGTLDSQTTPSYVLRIQVSDAVHIASCNMTINVDVVHRRRPVFTQHFYRVSVFESTETGSEVLRVSCDVESDCSNFSVVPTDAGFQIDASNGSLYTSKQTVYDSNQPYYLLTITARNPYSEPPVTSSVDVLIDVIRSQRLFVTRPSSSSSATGGGSHCDVMTCTGRHTFSQHRLAVTENTRPGTVLTTASATRNNGTVSNETSPNIDYVGVRKRYAIVGGNDGGHFVIDNVTGTLELQSSLDNELRSSYRLVIRSTVCRTDDDELSVVAIDVDDFNEFRPKFPVSVYRGTVAEDQLNSATSVFVLSVHANDDDAGRFGLVQYRLAEDHGRNFGELTGNRKLQFEINPDSGDLTVIATSSLVDFSWKTYNLTVVASDSGGFSDSAIITVDVVPHGFKDLHSMAHDFSLRFIQKSYEFFVTPGSQVGHVVGTVSTAIDGRGRREKIRYSISSRNSSLFEVDHQSGSIILIADLAHLPDVEHYVLPTTGEQVLLTARLKLIATRYQDQSFTARRHRQTSVAEAIVLIHVVKELSSTSVLPVTPSRQNTFDKAQLVLIIVTSVVVVVGSLVLGIIFYYFRNRRCERHRKLTSATGGFVLGVSGGSGRTAALPIITPMTVALTPVFPSAAKTSGLRLNDTERARPQSDIEVRHSRQKGGCFDDDDVEVRMINEGQQRDSHRVSSSAESSNCSLSSLARDRQQRHVYVDAGSEADASDSGLVADFSIIHPSISRSNKTVQPKTNTADRKYRHKPEVQTRRPVELECSSSSDENDATVVVPQPVYATIIGDVEDAIESFFQSAAGTDRLALEFQSLYDKYNPVFADMALLRNDGEKRSSFVYAAGENKPRSAAVKNRPFPVERYHLNPTSSTKHRNMSNDSGHASSTLSMMSTPPNLMQSSSPRSLNDDDEHSVEGSRLSYPLYGSGIDNWRNSRTSEPAVVTRGVNYARQSYC